MKQRLLWVALTVIGWSVAAIAEPVRIAQTASAILPAHEVVTIVRSAGFVPISPAMRRGERYVLRASAPDGREMRVIVNARRGEIISAVPVVPAAAGSMPGEQLGSYEPMPPGYVPPGPLEAYGPPVVYEGDRPLIYERRPMEPIPNASPRGARAVVPDADHARSSSEPPVAMREERGLLPPPPERFPSRAAPAPAPKPAAAKPAPVKRAAATPLPKPRPDIEADKPAEVGADDASKPAVAPAPSPQPKVDPRSLPH